MTEIFVFSLGEHANHLPLFHGRFWQPPVPWQSGRESALIFERFKLERTHAVTGMGDAGTSSRLELQQRSPATNRTDIAGAADYIEQA